MSLQKKEPTFAREQVASDNNCCIKRLNVYYPKQREGKLHVILGQ